MTKQGQEVFQKLVKTADVVIESFSPGRMDALRLGYSALSQIKPDIILTSITPFGQDGPYRDYRATDMVTMGMTGIMYQTGDRDTPPMHMSMPQAHMHGGADAAAALAHGPGTFRPR